MARRGGPPPLAKSVADKNNISPRLGVVWAPTQDHKTTVRASVGFYYDQNHWNLTDIYLNETLLAIRRVSLNANTQANNPFWTPANTAIGIAQMRAFLAKSFPAYPDLNALPFPGDTILGLRLDHGGHLTHGLKVNFSGRLYTIASYGVSRETNMVDYDEVLAIAKEHRPKLIICGGSAYPRTVDTAEFRKIADEVGALLMCDMAHFAGLVAAGLHPNPVEHCDFVTSTTHKTLAGPRAGFILCREEYAQAVDRAVFPGMQGGPLEHTIAAKATCFKIAMTDEFRQ